MARIVKFRPPCRSPRSHDGGGDIPAAAELGQVVIFPGIRVTRWSDAGREAPAVHDPHRDEPREH